MRSYRQFLAVCGESFTHPGRIAPAADRTICHLTHTTLSISDLKRRSSDWTSLKAIEWRGAPFSCHFSLGTSSDLCPNPPIWAQIRPYFGFSRRRPNAPFPLYWSQRLAVVLLATAEIAPRRSRVRVSLAPSSLPAVDPLKRRWREWVAALGSRRILFAIVGLLCTRAAPIDRTGDLFVIVVYLIAAAVILCGCVLFIRKARSRD